MGRITLERIPHDKQVAVRTLTLLGQSYRTISKALDISLMSITAINKQFPSNDQEVEHYKKRLTNEAYGLSSRAWMRVTDEKLEKMNAIQLTTIGAIGIDKARDMEGSNRPVFNLVNVVGDITKGLAEMKQKQQALMAHKESIDGV